MGPKPVSHYTWPCTYERPDTPGRSGSSGTIGAFQAPLFHACASRVELLVGLHTSRLRFCGFRDPKDSTAILIESQESQLVHV